MAAYQATRHESTRMTPYHQEPRFQADIEHNYTDLKEDETPTFHDKDTMTRYASRMMDIYKHVKDSASQNITKAQARQKKNFDKRHQSPTFTVGTMVLLKNMARNGRQGGKMEAHYTGPY